MDLEAFAALLKQVRFRDVLLAWDDLCPREGGRAARTTARPRVEAEGLA